MRIRYFVTMASLLLLPLQGAEEVTLEQAKEAGAKRSKYLANEVPLVSNDAPKADLEGFRAEIGPILNEACLQCHGPDKQKAKFRVDELDPDLVHGEHADWWLEVMDVLSNGEMPPADEGVEMADADRARVIDWLSGQVLVASKVKRSEGAHSSFRRMTGYEYNYALHDLLGLDEGEVDFAMGLPPEAVSEDGFKNSSKTLQITASQYATYLETNRNALKLAIKSGEDTRKRIFFDSKNRDNEDLYAREIVARFTAWAWRRKVTNAEVDWQMKHFARIRPLCEDFQQAVIETLATVLSSPRFLYLVQYERVSYEETPRFDDFELATRLSTFLWCSMPDRELLELASTGQLSDKDELIRQTKRMLEDPRHKRFSKHFVRQWLGMDLLDVLMVDETAYPEFDEELREAMKREPVAFFEEVLASNRSIMDFLHADYALMNERLAQHYGIDGVTGDRFRKVSLTPGGIRGGVLTQAGLLAMNSDGLDPNPLKRGIWMLESILNDPPPPPPPAVPEIDLAKPAVLKMTLKQRMEDHRNKAACASCHMKIDPWGIAFENFDAVGSWRTKDQRGSEIDASSLLYNKQKLDGVDGVKRYILASRQDQFARAIVHKLTTFALGRPLTFADHASIDRLTAELRKKGDGLTTLITLLVTSDLFRTP